MRWIVSLLSKNLGITILNISILKWKLVGEQCKQSYSQGPDVSLRKWFQLFICHLSELTYQEWRVRLFFFHQFGRLILQSTAEQGRHLFVHVLLGADENEAQISQFDVTNAIEQQVVCK